MCVSAHDDDRIGTELMRQLPLSLFSVDIDWFKRDNDTFASVRATSVCAKLQGCSIALLHGRGMSWPGTEVRSSWPALVAALLRLAIASASLR